MYRTVYVAALLGCVSWAHGQESHPEHAETVPQVFDARARALGELTTFGNQDGVLFSVGEASVVVPLQRKSSSGDGVRFSATQFQWSTDLFLDFTSSDCSGDPVVNNWK